jgi:hypothetical protein
MLARKYIEPGPFNPHANKARAKACAKACGGVNRRQCNIGNALGVQIEHSQFDEFVDEPGRTLNKL